MTQTDQTQWWNTWKTNTLAVLERPGCKRVWTEALYWLRMVIDSWTMVLIVILRRDFGSRFIDHRGVFGMALLLGFPLMWAGWDTTPIFWLLSIYLCMLLRAHIMVLHREARALRRGEAPVHPEYNGVSRIECLCPKCDEYLVKQVFEPFAVLLCGLVLLPFITPLALFLVIGAFCMAASMQMLVLHGRVKAGKADQAHLDAERSRTLWDVQS